MLVLYSTEKQTGWVFDDNYGAVRSHCALKDLIVVCDTFTSINQLKSFKTVATLPSQAKSSMKNHPTEISLSNLLPSIAHEKH